MIKFKVTCPECGVVKEEISQNGETTEPSAAQKAAIVAKEHEEEGGSDCVGIVQPKAS